MRSPALFLLLCSLATLGGCIQFHDIIQTEFAQAEERLIDLSVLNRSIRPLAIYHGFETAAYFDLLYFSDEMRYIFVQLRADKTGNNEQEREALLRRELEENNHTITFYVLSQVKDQSHISLSDPQSIWSFWLEGKAGNRIMPLSIKEVEMAPEIRLLFGDQFALFKKRYKIDFAAKDIAGKRYFMPGDELTLVCSSSNLFRTVSWQVPSQDAVERLAKGNPVRCKKQPTSLIDSFKSVTAERTTRNDWYW